MIYKPYVTQEIAERIYGDFISWGKEMKADSFGYYMDGEPWIRVGISVIGYRQFKEKIKPKWMQLTLF